MTDQNSQNLISARLTPDTEADAFMGKGENVICLSFTRYSGDEGCYAAFFIQLSLDQFAAYCEMLDSARAKFLEAK